MEQDMERDDATIAPFDAADYLDTPDAVRHYLTLVFASGNAADIRNAIGAALRSRGMTAMTDSTGLSRATLYRAFGDRGNPTLDTLLAVLTPLGLRLDITEREVAEREVT